MSEHDDTWTIFFKYLSLIYPIMCVRNNSCVLKFSSGIMETLLFLLSMCLVKGKLNEYHSPCIVLGIHHHFKLCNILPKVLHHNLGSRSALRTTQIP